MQTWRRILLPFSFFYGLVIRIRNYLYDSGRIESTSFGVPIISIGNLTTGGSGKTPHIEYLIKLFQDEYQAATISRGYGRKSKGYILAELPANTHLIGDEPMQYLTKFKKVLVCVSEDRAEAVTNLLKREKQPQVILLDDAFQHRRIVPGINILLIEFDSIFNKDFLLPAGNKREPWSSAKRADIVLISKSPSILAPVERKKITEYIRLITEKPLFFTYIKYGELARVFGNHNSMQMGLEYYREKSFTILLLAGIANPSGLIEYLRRFTDKLEILVFNDHHEFHKKDVLTIKQTFDNIASANKIIVTTEKDMMRLKNPDIDITIQKLPLFFLPIEIAFHQDEEIFKQITKDYVRKNQTNSRILTRKNN